jgi:putative Holliday junction resolvase
MGRILAIDFGTKRIGLAVTDPLKIIASSLATVTAHEAIVWLKNYQDRKHCFYCHRKWHAGYILQVELS